MHRRIVRLIVACSLLATACGRTQEIDELRALRRALDEELVSKRVQADNLNAYRRDREVLLAKLAPERAASKLEAPSPVGTAGASPSKLLSALRAVPENRRYTVRSFEVAADGRSKAALVLMRLPEPAVEAPLPAPVPTPLPKPNFFSGSEGKRLRLEVTRTQREVADLNRIVGEVLKVEAENRRLEAQLRALEGIAWGRLGAEPGLVDKLFAGDKPLLRSGKLEVVPGGFRITGKLSPGLQADVLRAAVPTGFAVQKLVEEAGTVTLEATAAK